MKERPIIFSGPMVRAILEGRKTMTRLVIKPQPEHDTNKGFFWKGYYRGLGGSLDPEGFSNFAEACPYGQPGDRLWVRETWQPCGCSLPNCKGAIYRADGEPAWLPSKWRPSIFMPRLASRIDLEITAVRVERLQDISEEDARSEGMTGTHTLGDFRELWDSINAKRGYSWDLNPWVWVVEFKRIEK